MKPIVYLVLVFGLLTSAPASALNCKWIRQREHVRYVVEQAVRGRFARIVNGKIQQFLDSLTPAERADISHYGDAGANRTATLLTLRRRLNLATAGFNQAKCSKGTAALEDGYPSKHVCLDDGLENGHRPHFYRALRLFADVDQLFVEGELRQDSRKKLVRPRADFLAGSYFIRVTLDTPQDEKRMIEENAAAYVFSDFDEYLADYELLPKECRASVEK